MHGIKKENLSKFSQNDTQLNILEHKLFLVKNQTLFLLAMYQFRNPLFFLLTLEVFIFVSFLNTIKILSILALVVSNIMRLKRIIKIKMFQDTTKKWVNYFKKMIRLFKKLKNFSLRSDARIFSILISPTGKLNCFVSPNTTDEEICRIYLKAKGLDLSKLDSQYQKMQEDLENLRERNDMLRREIGQRKGRDLQDLSFDQLCELEGTINSSLDAIHCHKLMSMRRKTDVLAKKVRRLKEINQMMNEAATSLELKKLKLQ